MSIFIYCPKMGKPKAVGKRYLGSWDILGSTVPLFTSGYQNDMCKNPFKGQTITNANYHKAPQALLPGVFKIKKISGYGINTFMLLSRYFQFKPKLSFVGGGSYLPNNKSFTSGRYQEVYCFQIPRNFVKLICKGFCRCY